MKTFLLVLALVALAVAVPPAAEANHSCSGAKLVARYACPWPGGVGEFCVVQKPYDVCFGPIL
jgi:hypothetical protein